MSMFIASLYLLPFSEHRFVRKISEIAQLDDNYQDIVVIFNVSAEVKSFTYPQADGFILHPIQAAGLDRQVKATQVLANRFVVPALTYAVLVKPRGI